MSTQTAKNYIEDFTRNAVARTPLLDRFEKELWARRVREIERDIEHTVENIPLIQQLQREVGYSHTKPKTYASRLEDRSQQLQAEHAAKVERERKISARREELKKQESEQMATLDSATPFMNANQIVPVQQTLAAVQFLISLLPEPEAESDTIPDMTMVAFKEEETKNQGKWLVRLKQEQVRIQDEINALGWAVDAEITWFIPPASRLLSELGTVKQAIDETERNLRTLKLGYSHLPGQSLALS